MNRTHVHSTNIESIGYENSTLEVKFLHGGIYHYYNVPRKHYEYMINNPHPGTYLARYIKGHYNYKRV